MQNGSDVKSNNILLNFDFEAYVADFGLAKFLQDTGTSECMPAIAGSYGYIAPGTFLVNTIDVHISFKHYSQFQLINFQLNMSRNCGSNYLRVQITCFDIMNS